ncbi:MAG: efflux RND transporter periplasmic adaptor subunit [Deltaproteobacteria bacterium]|nr:MAG: efflux RND transporter periplasmic adaptor subunit [Deltaproteobacteria bacterium]
MRFLLLLFTLLALGCAPSSPSGHDHAAGEVQLYTCGMHPEVVQEGPGQCPICGMDLTPMGEKGSSTAVFVEPHVIQTMGVRTAVVTPQTLFKHLRTLGEVDVAEDEVTVVNLRLSGWVERIHVDRTGDAVKRGQRLFDLYSPELVAAQEELLLAGGGPLATSARKKLSLFGIADSDIDAVVSSGKAARTLPIRAPASGFVLHKDVVEGARVSAGQDLYRIGNLSKVWVNAEVYEFDAPWVSEGQRAQAELSFAKGTVLEGKVAYVYPTLNQTSRTLRVRLEFDNPGVSLKPGMFATVYIEYRRVEDVLAVPREAVLHSGERELVFVARGDGHFEPREVTTGLEADHHLVEVLSGLESGEEVVTSGQFLLDSESQLQEALSKLISGDEAREEAPTQVYSCPMHPEVIEGEPSQCPKCGMDNVLRDATPEELEKAYGNAEAAYVCPMHPTETSDEPGRCGICGMFLEKREGAE